MNLLALVLVACTIQAVKLPPDIEKRRVLSDMVFGKMPATEGEIQASLEGAIRDPDPQIRKEGFRLIGAILSMASMPQVPPGYESAVRLRGVAEALKPAARAALDDADAGVRLMALGVVVRPQPVLEKPGAFAFSYEAVQLVASRFETDPSPMVRSFAVQTLTRAPHSDDARITAIAARILVAALKDADPYVVQYAGHLAFEAKAPEALPLLIKQLQNPSHVARMGVAIGLQGYKAAAKPYLPQMEEVLRNEPEGTTKKTIEAAIRLVRDSK